MNNGDHLSTKPDDSSQLAGLVRQLIVIAVIATIIALTVFSFHVLLILLVGILGGIFVRKVSIAAADKLHISESISLTCVWALIFVLVPILIWFLGPQIIEQTQRFMTELPSALESLRQKLSTTGFGAAIADQISYDNVPSIQRLASGAKWLTSSFLSFLFAGIVILFVAIYTSIEPRTYVKGVLHLVPFSRRKEVERTLVEIGDNLFWWLIGRMISMAAVGVMITTGLTLMGFELAITLGLIAGLLDFIPNFGPIIAALPALAIAAPQGLTTILLVAGLYSAAQVIEAYILYPLIMKRTVSVPPLLVIGAQVVLGALVGPLGFVLAVPVVIVSREFIRTFYVEDTLSDKV